MDAPVREGEVLAGKFRVDRVLGVGGMGVVVAATHLQLDQRVALKFMLREVFQDADSLARFQREARAAVRLKSEHVARVTDTGTFENGSPYIVMEYLEGTDLAHLLRSSGPLPPPVVAEYIVQTCDALAEAHTLGIVHRDLKPANLFLTRRADGSPLVKVLDFGISKTGSLGDPNMALTKTTSMLGSPLYMSPEQIRSSKTVDARTDVWSLGVILYELLGGRVPFLSDTLGGLLSCVMMDPLVPLSAVRPDLPPALVSLVGRCLEKDARARCQSVAEIAQGLAPFCPSRALPLVDRITTLLGAPSNAPPMSAAAISVLVPAGVAPSRPVTSGTGNAAWGTTREPTSGARGGARSAIAVTLGVLLLVGVALIVATRPKVRALLSPSTSASVAAATSAKAPPESAPLESAPLTVGPSSSASAANAPSSPSSAITASPGSPTTPSRSNKPPAPPRSAVPIASVSPPLPTTTSTPAASTPKKPGILDTSN